MQPSNLKNKGNAKQGAYSLTLLYGIPEYHTRKMQRVMNASARPVYCAPQFCHIRALLAELHWLPVHARIHHKMLLITVVTRMDSPKYGETLKFMYIKYQPIVVVLPKVYQV